MLEQTNTTALKSPFVVPTPTAFYYGGNGSTYTLKCGIDYENVMCSTEGYQWVQINGQTYKVDSVNCSYPPRNYCNASTAAVPTTTSTPRAVQTTSKAPNCNSCPRNVTVVGTSAPIAQFQGVNQWNCSDVVLRCSNPTGGRVTLYFLLNGKGATYANGNGTLYETINCSTEGYQWVNINGTGVPVNQVSCATS
uniref:C6 domain-containing protein n=1 Tax=Acrobeloides nanus TaxID=290746 RepID=A0A914E1R7_9BILA